MHTVKPSIMMLTAMYHQRIKDAYFAVNRVLSRPAGMLVRSKYRNPPPEGYRIHLGCGQNYIDGMINADGYLGRNIDLWLDLRNRLPFPDGSVSLVYSSHVIEHLYPDEALSLLREIHRVLRDDGVARIAAPSMEFAAEIAAGKATTDFPRAFDDPVAQAVNYLFCDGQHKYAYSSGLMTEMAQQAGFGSIVDYSAEHGVLPKSYGSMTLGNEPEGSLVVELKR